MQLVVVEEVEELLIDSLQVEDDQVEQVEDVLLLNAEETSHSLVQQKISMELMVQQPQIVQEVEVEVVLLYICIEEHLQELLQ